jgi:hypothetical protein
MGLLHHPVDVHQHLLPQAALIARMILMLAKRLVVTLVERLMVPLVERFVVVLVDIEGEVEFHGDPVLVLAEAIGDHLPDPGFQLPAEPPHLVLVSIISIISIVGGHSAPDRGGVPALDGIVTKPRAEEEIIPSPMAREEMTQGRRAEIEVGRMSEFSRTGG